MSLVRLIYVSSASHTLSDAELDEILASAARHNKPANLTGMLLYSDGSFMQVLEGETENVDAIYAKICQDRRHHSIVRLCTDPIDERDFATWSMGFKRLTASDAAANPQFAPLFVNGFDAERIGAKDGVALQILKEFSQRGYPERG